MRNLFFFIFYILVNPRLWKEFLKGAYLPVYIQYEWMKDLNVGTVIDVGAHQGKVSNVLNKLFPKAQIFAFEPSNEILKIHNRNIIVEQLAVGDKKGKSYLNETVFSPASSLLPLTKLYQQSLKKHLKITKKTEIEVVTLDNYFSNKKLIGPIFLKIDTQGMEGAVLRGGQGLLKKVSIIHIESPIQELYKGQAFFEEIYGILIKNGFRFIGDIPDSLFYPRFYLPDVMNCIFVRKELESFRSFKSYPKN